MKTFLLSAAGAFAALFAFNLLALFFLFSILSAAGNDQGQPGNLVLTMDLRAPMTDLTPTGGLAAFSGEQGFTDVVTKLEAAADDPAVKGLFIRGSQVGTGSARAEELRAAIRNFRNAGKYVIAHAQDSYSTGPSGYRAIAAADEIWMRPGSSLLASGVTFETLFLGQLFENLSIVPEIEAFYEYKNAPNMFKETDYTEPHREAMTALAESIWSVSLADIAEDRDMAETELRAVLESGPISAEEAINAGLTDEIGWPEDAQAAAKMKSGGNNLLTIAQYQPPAVGARATQIAVVGGEGAIVTGGTTTSAFGDSSSFASDTVAQSILKAGNNSRVKAVVFRVDSPGGSPDASDQIWRAVQRVQEDMGKPVVVSMGSVAASGGYYVSTGADYIFANPSTITG
ncbi:MAG: S49 family peptidase, partial [Pseudomonadota bacterium]